MDNVQGAVTDHPMFPNDFKLVLREELLRRCRKNPGYSMRAFAKLLSCDSSTLSKIMSGKRPVGRITIRKFSERLELKPELMANLLVRKGINPKTTEPHFQLLTEDQFQFISDWYHYAILELILLKDFVPDLRWIARKLGITVTEAKAASERLFRLGLLQVTRDNRWTSGSGHHTNAGHPVSALAYRKMQRQILEQALRALDTVPLELRDQSSITVAINSSKLPEIVRQITRFRRRLAAMMDETNSKDSVYQLSISLFPITQKGKTKNAQV